MITTSETGGASGSGVSDSALGSSLFQELFSVGLGDPDVGNRAKFFQHVFVPLASYLSGFERAGEPDDERALRAQLIIDSQVNFRETAGKKLARMLISGISKDGRTIEILAFPAEQGPPIHIQKPISDIDLSKVRFIPSLRSN